MAESTKSDKPKRRVKNPETFRERSLKAQQEDAANKPSALSLTKKALAPLSAVSNNTGVKRVLKPIKFVLRIIFPKYFRSSFQELKLVTWPNFKQSRQLTFAVIVFAIIFGASIAVLDYGLDGLFKHILLK